jgi:hypothetical protein
VTVEPISLLTETIGKSRYFHYNIYFCIVSTGSVTVVVQIKKKTTYGEVRTNRFSTKT